jgi:hypothetical protein
LTADPFAAVPDKPADVEVRRDSRGMIHLRRRQALSGLKKRVADWLGYDYSRKVELDEHGTRYFALVDGVSTLGAIVDEMTASSGRPRREVEEGVVLFTKKLMTMNMIVLRVPRETGVP